MRLLLLVGLFSLFDPSWSGCMKYDCAIGQLMYPLESLPEPDTAESIYGCTLVMYADCSFSGRVNNDTDQMGKCRQLSEGNGTSEHVLYECTCTGNEDYHNCHLDLFDKLLNRSDIDCEFIYKDKIEEIASRGSCFTWGALWTIVGVSAACILIPIGIIIGCCFWKRRKMQKKEKKEVKEKNGSSSSGPSKKSTGTEDDAEEGRARQMMKDNGEYENVCIEPEAAAGAFDAAPGAPAPKSPAAGRKSPAAAAGGPAAGGPRGAPAATGAGANPSPYQPASKYVGGNYAPIPSRYVYRGAKNKAASPAKGKNVAVTKV